MGRDRETNSAWRGQACQGRGYVPAVAKRVALIGYLLDLHWRECCWAEAWTVMVVLLGLCWASGIVWVVDDDGWIDGWIDEMMGE